MSFDHSIRRYPVDSSLDSSRFQNVLRSPENNLNNSILRNKNEALATSFRGRNTRSHHSVSKKVSYATDNASTNLNISKEPEYQRRSSRKTTPKKYYFFSDYMNEYNPNVTEYKTPMGSNTRPAFPERPILDNNNNNTTAQNSFRSHGPASARKEYIPTIPTIEQREPLPVSRTPDANASETYTYKNWRAQVTPSRDKSKSPVREADEGIERRLKENRKEEIKDRLSKLSEKLYSPLKSNLGGGEKRRADDIFTRPPVKESAYLIKDHLPTLTQESSSIIYEKTESDYRGSKREDPGLDIKQRIMVKEYENSIANLKTHLEKVEKSNTDIIAKLREELKNTREELVREKQEASTKTTNEVRQMNDKTREFEERVRQERDKIRELEEKMEDNKILYEKKVSEMTREIERVRNEKERKVDELNNLLKSQGHSQKEIINKTRTENEIMIKKLREDQNAVIKDLTSQLAQKQTELERLQREKAEAIGNLNEKVVSLQELTKNNQDTYNKLTRTLGLKDDEIDKLNRKLAETKKDCSILAKQVEELDLDKAKLEEENERLKSKAARLEKMIYGKGKRDDI